MSPLHLTKLTFLMERTSGSAEVKIGLIDGPVATEHPDLTRETLREILGPNGSACKQAASMACQHGTFVAGILSAMHPSGSRWQFVANERDVRLLAKATLDVLSRR